MLLHLDEILEKKRVMYDEFGGRFCGRNVSSWVIWLQRKIKVTKKSCQVVKILLYPNDPRKEGYEMLHFRCTNQIKNPETLRHASKCRSINEK